MSVDWGIEAQKAAEARLDALEEFAEACDELPVEKWPEHPNAAGPYCGCRTCVVRETLDAAWPIMRRAALDGAQE